MDLTQQKLSKSEWEYLEVPSTVHEMKILSNYIKEHKKIKKFKGSNFQRIEKEVRNNYRNRWISKK